MAIDFIVYTMYHFNIMKITVRQWGNSLAVRIPKIFAVQLGIESGIDMKIDATDSSIILSKSENNLLKLLKQITPENLHRETDTGETSGSEIW
ncbi:MAG: AbrB/MazE/SpoVT family DNA-binding domain-containing protein [Candidatus Peribacteraceae bacterium]|nr:AbrB/MazE/SpoVT family DNA-binding domain-containing protein [Candidatus Peribacteraceae bacterium]